MSDNDTAILAIIKPEMDGVVLSAYIRYNNYSNETVYDAVDYTIPHPPSSGLPTFLFYPPQNVTRLNGSYIIGIRINSSIYFIIKAAPLLRRLIVIVWRPLERISAPSYKTVGDR